MTARLPDTNLTRNSPPISREKEKNSKDRIITFHTSPILDRSKIVPRLIKSNEKPNIWICPNWAIC